MKGILDEDAKTIEVETKDSFFTINLQDYLNAFASQAVSITIQTQSEEDLELPEATEDDDNEE